MKAICNILVLVLSTIAMASCNQSPNVSDSSDTKMSKNDVITREEKEFVPYCALLTGDFDGRVKGADYTRACEFLAYIRSLHDGDGVRVLKPEGLHGDVRMDFVHSAKSACDERVRIQWTVPAAIEIWDERLVIIERDSPAYRRLKEFEDKVLNTYPPKP